MKLKKNLTPVINVQNSSTPLIVVAAALMGRDMQVLMQRRRIGSVHGGLWEFPGGKVEAGEAPESALVREIREELGLDVSLDTLVPVTFASGRANEADSSSRPLVVLLYTSRSWSGDPQCLDGEEIGWHPLEALISLDMPPLDYPLADGLCAAMQNKFR